jgi:hypothetical protein
MVSERILESVHKLFTAFQTYINHEILDMGKGIALFKRTAEKCFMLNDSPADSGTAETYTAYERKMAVSPQEKAMSVLWYWET